jgi:hypothetical protein
MTHHITITLSHCINGNTGHVDSKPKASFRGHDDTAIGFLRRNVRGWHRGTDHFVTLPYARKIQQRATAVGFEVTVKETPRATPAQAQVALKRFRQQLARWKREVTND